METVILLMSGFLCKHFLVDFVLQTPFQYRNKGTYGHAGGLLHAGLHAVGTCVVLVGCGIPVLSAIVAGVIDGIIHYHIDWAKVNLNAYYGWSSTNSESFWWLLGFDQLLHQLTYVCLITFLLKGA